MPIPPLDKEVLLEAVAAVEAAGGSQAQAARDLGMNVNTFKGRYRIAERRGLTGRTPEAPEGYQVKTISENLDANGNLKSQSVKYDRESGEVFEVPTGHAVKGESALLDPDGRIIAKWVKTAREHEKGALAAAEILKEYFKDYRGVARPMKAPDFANRDLLTFFPCADWHLGLLVWGQETNGENWDLPTAVNRIFRTYQHLISTTPKSETCVILGGGDLLHSDNYENKTSRSGHTLDVDGRWPKVLKAASELMTRIVELAAQRHKNVIVRLLPGNHDEQSAIALTFFLEAHFRNESRVVVDCDPALYWWYVFGKVMLGSTHGHTVKIDKMPGIMAHRRAEDWGRTQFRYVHGFHLHHSAKTATEGEGVITEIHQSPAPQDAWHYGSGFLSGRSMKAIVYHREYGEIARSQMAMSPSS